MNTAPANTTPARIIEVRRSLLKANDLRARELRQRFERAGVRVISLVSSPGAGKTALLELLLTRLRQAGCRTAALVGDLATDNDAVRLARSGAPVRQISTGNLCHLEARMVEEALADWELQHLDLLFLENVGNLVCPSAYDLGEAERWVLLSVTEGEDKPLKYPSIFNTADLAVITKLDLAAAAGCDLGCLRAHLAQARPGMPVAEVSARSGTGVAELLRRLRRSPLQ